MPFASKGIFEASVEKTLQNKMNLDFSTKESIHESVLELFEDVKFLEVTNALYSCGCSKEMFIGIIFSLSKEDQEDILEQKVILKASCSMCGKEYIFTPEEIELYLK